jgi:hypothetical protein
LLTADGREWTRIADEKLCCSTAHGPAALAVGLRQEIAATAIPGHNDGQQSFSSVGKAAPTIFDLRPSVFICG